MGLRYTMSYFKARALVEATFQFIWFHMVVFEHEILLMEELITLIQN